MSRLSRFFPCRLLSLTHCLFLSLTFINILIDNKGKVKVNTILSSQALKAGFVGFGVQREAVGD